MSEPDNIVVDFKSERYKGGEYEMENEFVECAKAMMWTLFILRINTPMQVLFLRAHWPIWQVLDIEIIKYLIWKQCKTLS